MAEASEHIRAWEAAGLIDAATAERLRAAAASSGETAAAGPAPSDASASMPAGQPSQVAVMFGPSVTVPEVFGYLGTAFLLAGWSVFVTRSPFGAQDNAILPGIGGVLAAIGLVALGLVLRRGGNARRSRSAGVAFLVAVAYAGGGIVALATSAGLEESQAAVVGAGGALAVAIGLRMIHPAVLTQVGLLGAVTGLAATILSWFESAVFPTRFNDDGSVIAGGPDPLLLALASAIWWLAWAVLIGLIGLREARSAERGDAAAGRRAAVTRFWAGLVAVIGVSMAVTRSAAQPNGEYGRVMKAWVGDLAILAVSAVLLERAFRRDATAYVYAAALGLIIALSDFNATYLSATPEIAFVIEGAILLGVGLAADRLRRRIGLPDHAPHPLATITDVDPTSLAADRSMTETTARAVEPAPETPPAPPGPALDTPPSPPPDRPQSGGGR